MNLSQAVTNEMNIIELEDGLREDKERFCNIAHSSFKSACDLLQTPDEAEDLSDVISSFMMKLVARRSKNSMGQKGMSFFGEEFPRRGEQFDRHIFAYERR